LTALPGTHWPGTPVPLGPGPEFTTPGEVGAGPSTPGDAGAEGPITVGDAGDAGVEPDAVLEEPVLAPGMFAPGNGHCGVPTLPIIELGRQGSSPGEITAGGAEPSVVPPAGGAEGGTVVPVIEPGVAGCGAAGAGETLRVAGAVCAKEMETAAISSAAAGTTNPVLGICVLRCLRKRRTCRKGRA
jgi:hypothetical protein